MITQDLIKNRLAYSYKTGEFRWIKPESNSVGFFDVAGANCRGYVRIRIAGKSYFAHRLAWLYVYGEWPKNQIDHINGKKNDNRISNLRCVDNAENQKNAKLREDNKSGITGVSYMKQHRKWRARISVDGVTISLGWHKSLLEACCARKSAENRYGFHINHGSRRH